MTDQAGYEIDFLPVGNEARSGDAIAVRYGSPGQYKVLIYDGGTKESGQALVDHVRTYYGTTFVDHVVNSHPDGDHASGLSVVLEQLSVGELWMHRPWSYSSAILGYFKDGRITDNSLAEHLKQKMAAAYALEKIAEERGIPVHEPFLGAQIGGFLVLSPEQGWYMHQLIPEFEKSPEKKKAEELAAMSYAEKALMILKEAAQKAESWLAEKWDLESLRENVNTSAENESSVVLYAPLNGGSVLLTGDAGIRSLTATAEVAEAINLSLPNKLSFAQIPHHGSRNNVSTSVLDRIIGPRKPKDDGNTTKIAFVSASNMSSSHPRKMVINAFVRRGCKICRTQGQTIRHSHNMPPRDGWSAAPTLKFSSEVEAWD